VVAKKLGGGYASTVHLAIDKATGTQVAIKVYHRCKLSQLNNYQVQREIRIHSCLDHKNVLQLVSLLGLRTLTVAGLRWHLARGQAGISVSSGTTELLIMNRNILPHVAAS
jgi:serine/threonine protein kinase